MPKRVGLGADDVEPVVVANVVAGAVAVVVVAPEELGAPKMGAADDETDFAPKIDCEGVDKAGLDSSLASALLSGFVNSDLPEPLALVELWNIDLDPLVLESGDVCIESPPRTPDWPNVDGFAGVDRPNVPVEGAVVVALGCPNMLPAVDDVAGAA